MSQQKETPVVDVAPEFVAPDPAVIAESAEKYLACFPSPAEALHALAENVSEYHRQLGLLQRHRGKCWNGKELVADKNCDALYVAGVRFTLRNIETEKGKRVSRSTILNSVYDATGKHTYGAKRELGETSPAKPEDAIRYALMSFGTYFESIVDMRERTLTDAEVKEPTVKLSEYQALQEELAKLKEQLASK